MAPDALSSLIGFLLSAMGATVLIVWPETGPTAWLREKVLRRVLPGRVGGVLDCYICMSFWMGLAFGALWWCWTRNPMYWCGCLMAPVVFWVVLNRYTHESEHDSDVEPPASSSSRE